MENPRQSCLWERTQLQLPQPSNRRTIIQHPNPIRKRLPNLPRHKQTIRQYHQTNNPTTTISQDTGT